MRRRTLFAALLLTAAPAAHAATPADKPLEVGFAEADISPPIGTKPVFMAGFGQNRKATGTLDPLFVRVVVLRHGDRKIALASADLVGLFLHRIERMRQKLPGFTHVLLSCTHNHEGPDTLGLWGASPFQSGIDPDYMTRLEEQVVKAVEAADAAAKPVTATLGTARAPELLHDGREPIVKHDELTAIAFADAGTKKAVGLVVQWNCHPETLASKNTRISSDYVGYTVKALKNKHGCPVVYLTGTVGGLMTSLKVPIKDEKGVELQDGTVEKTEAYGRAVARLADKAVAAAKPVRLTPIGVRTRPLFLPVDNKIYQVGAQLGVLQRPIYLWKGDTAKADPAPAKRDPKQRPAARTELTWLRLGELDIACIPGEIYPELVLDQKPPPADPNADFPDAPFEPTIYGGLAGPHRMLIGLASDEIGYILPKRQWDEQPPFAYGRKTAPYGEVNSLGPETGPLLCNAFRDLVKAKK